MTDEAQDKSKTASRRVNFWLAQAEHHIEEHRYYLARKILESIHDPRTHALLDDLNAIAPPPSLHQCPLCNFQEFTWHRAVMANVTHEQQYRLEVDRREVYARVCISCSNVQIFLQLPDYVELTS